MPIRRCADPVSTQYVWDAIKSCTAQRQTADVARLAKIIQKYADCSQAQAELYIKQTLDDDFIIEVKRIAQKGTHVGAEFETFRINRQGQEDLQTPVDDGHDWYCIECHLAGDVTMCAGCSHVFHAECSKKASRKLMRFPPPSLPVIPKVENNVARSSTPIVATPPEETKDPLALTDDNKATVAMEVEKNGDAEERKTPVEQDKLEKLEKIEKVEKVEKLEKTDIDKPVENGTDEKPPVGVVIKPEDYIYDESLCSICNMGKCDPGSGLDVDELNYLLNFILTRIKSWVPDHLTSNLNGTLKHEWYTPAEMSWRAGQLFYVHMDMAAVELKIRTKDYHNFATFKGDVLTMLHNIAIFHGVGSQEYGAAEFMIRDMDYDITELQNCVDCYRHSNEKFNAKWFCLPCRRPHRLVFAKQKGYPFWPAKVIKETDSNTFDVRFFGGKYERAILTRNCIKPITTSISSLHIKKTSSFNKAMDELKLHQSLLDNPSEVAAIKAIVGKPRAKPRPRKSMPAMGKPIINMNTSLMSNVSISNMSTGSLNSSAIKSNTSFSSMSDDVYEFHDDLPGDLNPLNGKDEPRLSKSPPKATASASASASASATASASASAPAPTNKRKISYQEEDEEEEDVPQAKARRTSAERTPPLEATTPLRESDVINISDIDDEREGFAEFNDPSQNLVTSSTELLRDGEEAGMQKLDQQYTDAVEKMRRQLEQCKGNKELIVTAMDAMQAEIDRIQTEHNDTLKRLFESHNTQISETKKKQWCFNCEQEAIYHCCWNTAYCSPMCQQQHWQAEHKKVCRRKR